MKKRYRFCVDAGNISVIDYDYVVSKYGEMKVKEATSGKGKTNSIINIEPGEYKVTVWIPKSHLGDIDRVNKIKTNGKLIIGDACYLFDNDGWDKFIADTGCLSNDGDNFCSIGTGGDGSFRVEVDIEKVDSTVICKTITEPKSDAWNKERVNEYSSLETLLNKLTSLNKGSNFLNNVQECITIAEDLTKTDIETCRESFLSFLRSQIIKSNTTKL